MKVFGIIILILVTLFCKSSGRTVEGTDTERAYPTKGPSIGFGKGFLWQQICKNDTAMETNVLVCLVCRGFSRLCFSIPSPAFGNKPASSAGNKPTASSSAKPPSTSPPGVEEPSTEAGKSI